MSRTIDRTTCNMTNPLRKLHRRMEREGSPCFNARLRSAFEPRTAGRADSVRWRPLSSKVAEDIVTDPAALKSSLSKARLSLVPCSTHERVHRDDVLLGRPQPNSDDGLAQVFSFDRPTPDRIVACKSRVDGPPAPTLSRAGSSSTPERKNRTHLGPHPPPGSQRLRRLSSLYVRRSGFPDGDESPSGSQSATGSP